jgi:hypothetical protein
MRTGAKGLEAPPDPRRRRSLERRASYLRSLASWRPHRFEGTLHLVECGRWSRRGYGSSWARLAADTRKLEVPGEHEGLLIEHGEEIGTTLARWLDEASSGSR